MKSTKYVLRTITLASIAGLALLGTGCAMEGGDVGDLDENVAETGMSFDEFMSVIYQEPDTGVYIVNGDETIEGFDKLVEFYTKLQDGALIVHQSGGADAKWSDTQKLNLTYCVSTSFGSHYDAVVQAMASATGAWEAAANIKYVHVSAQDSNCTSSNKNVVFDVNPVNAGGRYLARAFFPNQSRSSRNVLIDGSSFGNISPWSLTGVLRHELGHTLGFRHEHTRPEAGVCYEDSSWRPLTNYDSSSVMHYPQCNGTQNGDLTLTNLDKAGAAALYGSAGGGGGGGKGGGKK